MTVYEFGPFRLEPSERRLLRDGDEVRLAPRLLDLIIVLVESSGTVVERQQLLDDVWGDVIVTEANLTQSIWLLRKALDDSGETYIQTVHKTGYRFVAEVSTIEATSAEHPVVQPATASGSSSAVQSSSDRHRSLRRPIVVGVVLAGVVVVLAAALVGWRLWPQERAAHSRRLRPAVVVLDLANLSHSEGYAWLGTAVAEMITAELAASAELRAVPRDRVADLSDSLDLEPTRSPAPGTGKTLERLLGPGYLVAGSFVVLESGSDSDDRIRLDLQLLDLGSGDIVGAVSEAGTVTDLFEIVALVGTGARAVLGVDPVGGDERGRLRASSPKSREAVELYADGLARLRDHAFLEAADVLARAVEAEPTFPLSRVALARAWAALGYQRRAADEAALALELAGSLPQHERKLVAARCHEYREEWQPAIELYEALFEQFPDQLEYGLALLGAQLGATDTGGAQNTIDRLRQLPFPLSEDLRIDVDEAHLAALRSQPTRQVAIAQEAADRARSAGLSQLARQARYLAIEGMYRAGELDEALRLVQDAKAECTAAGDLRLYAAALNIEGGIFRLLDDYDRARAAWDEAISVLGELGNRRSQAVVRGNMAVLESDTGDIPASIEQYREVIAALSDVGDTVNQAVMTMNLAATLAEQARLDEAAAETRAALATAVELGNDRLVAWAHGLLASLELHRDNLEVALAHAGEAASIARHAGLDDDLVNYLGDAAWIQLDRGELTTAGRHLSEIKSLLADIEAPRVKVLARELEAVLVAARGDLATAEALQREAVALELSDLPADIGQRRLQLAWILLDGGRPAEAERVALTAVERLEEVAAQAATDAWAVIAHARLDRGDVSAARAVVDSHLVAARTGPYRRSAIIAMVASGRVLAAVDELERARELLDGALAEATDDRNLWLRLDTLLAIAELEVVSGNTAAARQALAEVLRLAVPAGLELHADTARRALSELP